MAYEHTAEFDIALGHLRAIDDFGLAIREACRISSEVPMWQVISGYESTSPSPDDYFHPNRARRIAVSGSVDLDLSKSATERLSEYLRDGCVLRYCGFLFIPVTYTSYDVSRREFNSPYCVGYYRLVTEVVELDDLA